MRMNTFKVVSALQDFTNLIYSAEHVASKDIYIYIYGPYDGLLIYILPNVCVLKC